MAVGVQGRSPKALIDPDPDFCLLSNEVTGERKPALLD
jgi:hypothetical protein